MSMIVDVCQDRTTTTHVDRLNFTPFQTQLDIALCKEKIIYVGGGYGSGKTAAAAFKVLLWAINHPWTPDYGTGNPTIVISAPTARIMHDTTMPELLKVIPEVLIRKHIKGYNEILLTNGCMIKLRSGESTFEGLSIGCMWIDEISHYEEAFFINALARLRDPFVNDHQMICSGIPYKGGWVEEQFAVAQKNSKTFMMSAYANPYLPIETINTLRNRISKEDANTMIYGKWMKQKDLIYSEFSLKLHLREEVRFNPAEKYYFGIDPGANHSACLVAQLKPVRLKDGSQSQALHVVDEIIEAQSDVEKLMGVVKRKGYANPSGAFIDPTTRRDEINSARRVFPGLNIIIQPHKSDSSREDFGIAALRTALQDANDNVRIGIAPKLKHVDNGLVKCFQISKYNQKTGRPKIFDQCDHSVDALRYLVVGLLSQAGHFRAFSKRRR